MDTINPNRVAGQDLQAILGISHQTVARLQKSGVLVSVGAGKFDLATAVQAYVRYVDGGREALQAGDGRRQVLAEQHRKLKIANDLRERTSIPLAEAELVADEAMLTFRSNLDGVAGRLSSELAGLSDPAVIKGRLADEHRRILQACSDRFSRLGAAAEAHGGGDPAAPEADGRPVGQRGKGAAERKRRARPVPK